MKRWLRLAVVFALVVAAPARCGAAAVEPQQRSICLFELTTARGIIDGKPSQPTRLFASDDEVVYLWYAADGCALGTTIRSVWTYLETDPPFRLAEGAVTVDRSGKWGQFNFRLAPGRRWAVGRYQIELWIGDDLVAEATFSVSPRVSAQIHSRYRATVS